MTKRETILQALNTLLGTISGTTVYRSRVNSFLRSEAPAILLTWIRDTPDETALGYLDWSMQFRVAVIARGDIADSLCDSIVASVHNKLLTNTTLSGLTMDIIPGAADLQLIDADKEAGVVSSEFTAFYRTTRADLTA